jgi:hypothetical protein
MENHRKEKFKCGKETSNGEIINLTYKYFLLVICVES